MGILPLQFINGETGDKLGLKGDEVYDIVIHEALHIGDEITVKTNSGISFKVKVRLDTLPEIEYFKNNGILLYVLRKLIKN
jgi:aconitate hydratase